MTDQQQPISAEDHDHYWLFHSDERGFVCARGECGGEVSIIRACETLQDFAAETRERSLLIQENATLRVDRDELDGTLAMMKRRDQDWRSTVAAKDTQFQAETLRASRLFDENATLRAQLAAQQADFQAIASLAHLAWLSPDSVPWAFQLIEDRALGALSAEPK